MEFTYENSGANTYLVYEIENKTVLDSVSLGMITNNRIMGVVPVVYTQMNEKKYLKYNVTGKVSLEQFFTGAVNSRRLLGVFKSMIAGIMSADEYMIDLSMFLLNLEYIFVDVSTCETELICWPVIKKQQKPVELDFFFKFIMFNTQFDHTENCDYVAKIISYLNGHPSFSLLEFKKMIEQLSATEVQSVATKQAPQLNNSPSNIYRAPNVPQQPINTQVQQPNVMQQQIQQTPPQQMQQEVQATAIPFPKNEVGCAAQKQEKPMSFFYLIQHYSKENKEIYNAQKESKKANKNSKTKKIVKKANKQPVNQMMGFAVPGSPQMMQNAAPAVMVNPPQANRNPVQSKQVAATVPPTPHTTHNVAPISPNVAMPTTGYAPNQQQGGFGETTVLSSSTQAETTVLNAVSTTQGSPYLVRRKNNERIPIEKPIFRIGKEKSYVDCFISDNPAISRSHASIIRRGNDYFVVDTNSKNHTYVNGAIIQSNSEIKLEHGVNIRFANEEFSFNLY